MKKHISTAFLPLHSTPFSCSFPCQIIQQQDTSPWKLHPPPPLALSRHACAVSPEMGVLLHCSQKHVESITSQSYGNGTYVHLHKWSQKMKIMYRVLYLILISSLYFTRSLFQIIYEINQQINKKSGAQCCRNIFQNRKYITLSNMKTRLSKVLLTSFQIFVIFIISFSLIRM